MDLSYLRYKWCPCCCSEKNNDFAESLELVKIGRDEIEADLDLVRLIRRIRATGIALYYLTNKSTRTIVARMAEYKPLRHSEGPENKKNDGEVNWDEIHNQKLYDKF